jgi:hypothetical protein
MLRLPARPTGPWLAAAPASAFQGGFVIKALAVAFPLKAHQSAFGPPAYLGPGGVSVAAATRASPRRASRPQWRERGSSRGPARPVRPRRCPTRRKCPSLSRTPGPSSTATHPGNPGRTKKRGAGQGRRPDGERLSQGQPEVNSPWKHTKSRILSTPSPLQSG